VVVPYLALGKINSTQSNKKKGKEIDLYFALIRLTKYGDRERLIVKLVDRYSTAKYNELFVYFDDRRHDGPPQTVYVENDRDDVDLCCLWPLMVGRRTLRDQPKMYAIENYPDYMLGYLNNVNDDNIGTVYRMICENATKIGKNEEVVRHFESKLALYHAFIHEKKKIEKERRAQERRDAELKRDLLEKELVQEARERDLYYDMPVLVPALEPVSDEIIMPTADGMIIMLEKLAHLKRAGIVSYYEVDQTGKLAIVLTDDIYTKKVLSFLDVQ